MEREEQILKDLAERFPGLAEGASIAKRRICVEVSRGIFMGVIAHVAREMGFTHLCTITGLDNGSAFEFIYHIAGDEGIVLNLKIRTPRENAVIESVLPVFQGAVFYERELEGLLGVKVEGLPEGRQYPLPDNWPEGQYPMRKDWAPDTLQKKD